MTPELLRDEEMQESAKKLRKLSLEYLANLRDFEAVCRGEKLVIKRQSLKNHFSELYTFHHS